MPMSDFGTKLLYLSPSQGVCASLLCRDVAWLTEEVLFRNKDVGFGGSVVDVVHHSLSLLSPHLIIAALPSRSVFCQSKEKQRTLISSIQQNCVAYQKSNFPFSEASDSITVLFLLLVCVSFSSRRDPFIMPSPSLAAILHLTQQAQTVTHTFIFEAVGGE